MMDLVWALFESCSTFLGQAFVAAFWETSARTLMHSSLESLEKTSWRKSLSSWAQLTWPNFSRRWDPSRVQSSACWVHRGPAGCTNRWGRRCVRKSTRT
eukprot:symbB.v1.2.035986.t1/scaffold4975.1/size32198/1